MPLAFEGDITTSFGPDAIAMRFSTSVLFKSGRSAGKINTESAPLEIVCRIASFNASFSPKPGSATPTAPWKRAKLITLSSGETTAALTMEVACCIALSTSAIMESTSRRRCSGANTALKLDFASLRRLTGMIAQVGMTIKHIYCTTHLYDGIQVNSNPQFGREISYSRNVFLPITNLCRNRCSYCGFRRDPNDGAWFMSPEEVIKLAERAKAAGCSEALLTLGERPEIHAEAREKLKEFGYKNTIDCLNDICKRILELGLLPHTNAGLLNERELRHLRQFNASMGLMLECATELPVHRNSPGKDPKLRLEIIEAAGKLRIPFTTGLLIGVGESSKDRVRSLHAIQELHERYNHIQEVIIQPFAPKPNTRMANCPRPSEAELLTTVAMARSLMPEINIQVPPNLLDYNGGIVQRGGCGFEKAVKAVLLAGANEFGGISSLTPDFINPEDLWPSVAELRAAIVRAGFAPHERLPIYPRYARDERFMSKEVRERVLELADEEGYRAG